jgi:dsDNA-specific endonuclease/ATPase MutS2
MSISRWLQNIFPIKTSADSYPEVEDAKIDPFNPFPEPVRIEITDSIDLHSIQPREVKAVVEEYLHQAHVGGFRTVRIIHGKGVGVQREIVRSVLTRSIEVQDWTDAPPDAGGWGATVVHLKSTK